MKIMSASQMREWDAFTLREEPVASLDLMERAATSCYNWILSHGWVDKPFHIFCGKGNNGGDGLALARLLLQQGKQVTVYILENGNKGTDDFQSNLHRLHPLTFGIHFIQSEAFFPQLEKNAVVVDALFGTGLQRPLQGVAALLVQHINQSGATVLSIDLPSGMYADENSSQLPRIHAAHTLTFQAWKLCFLMEENHESFGEVHLLDIGLHPDFETAVPVSARLTDVSIIRSIRKVRSPFSHKGHFGHALLVGGSYGKMGAMVLASRSCLQSGAGLVTAFIPSSGYAVLQTAVPEAMVQCDKNSIHISTLPNEIWRFQAVGVGPGMGLQEETGSVLLQLLKELHQPVVLDADALNLLSIVQEGASYLPPESILTPHPKEFERLCGSVTNNFERMERAREKAKEWNCYIVLKTHHTLIACPDGRLWFNSTGNAGMAKAGSGDVLTGLLTGLLAQGYTPEQACILGVYLHGLAGDLAAAQVGQEAMIASDTLQMTGAAFRSIY
jgi:NAD(P)H-hydrate epimerase